ncbi:sigma-70 family RNA polymerase sigma factor [Pedobacter frigidisoli]|uniref:RNA polymerase sigma factor n=1 Tax=Pedobacter frigidisoli TaxID=2530455 RepID=UPI002930DA72|nr:sigma-70 family RNA polymerase sigma factor [Pedobacter frigidisoli]
MQETKSDLDLWLLIKDGDQSVFERIYDLYFDDLYEYGYRFCKDEFLVKDKVQDLFVNIWSKREKLGTASNIKAYLFSALRNSLNEQHRNTSIRRAIMDQFTKGLPLTFSLEFEFIELENQRQRMEKLHNALNQLNPRQKEIIYLRYIQDIPYDDAADIMGITTKSAYKLSARAIDSLKNLIAGSDKELYALLILAQIYKLKY